MIAGSCAGAQLALIEGSFLESATGIGFDSPRILFALALPILLLLFAKLRSSPEQRATGSLALWRRLNLPESQAARTSRPGVPLPLWLLTGALVAAILAIAGPRRPTDDAGRLWRVIMDRSPGMHLELLPQAEGQGRSRLEAGLDAALAHLVESWGEGDRVRFTSPGREPVERSEPTGPPEAWLAADAWAAPRPDFEAHDTRGTLVVTDRAVALEAASLFASGGALVPGPIGRRAGQLVEWLGGEELQSVEAAPRLVLVMGAVGETGEDLGVVFELVRTWCRARGFELAVAERDGSEEPAITIHFAQSSGAEEARVGRDGWSLTVRPGELLPAQLAEGSPLTAWLQLGQTELVAYSPGHLFINWSPVPDAPENTPRGDPAAFAVSWSELLDRVVLPEPGAVSLADRQAAGPSRAELRLAPPRPAPVKVAVPLDVALAWTAALLAAAAACSLIARKSGG